MSLHAPRFSLAGGGSDSFAEALEFKPYPGRQPFFVMTDTTLSLVQICRYYIVSGPCKAAVWLVKKWASYGEHSEAGSII